MNTTITKNTESGNSAISDLIARVIDKFDTNKDNQLNATEFGSFLHGLLDGGASAIAPAETSSAVPAASTKSEAAIFNPTTASWDLLHGFDARNYYNPDMNTMKYQFARIAADYDPRQPGALNRLVGDPRFAAAFPNAKIVGKDSIDFGGQLSEGNNRGLPVGVVDVGEAFIDTCCGNAWQWLDQSERA
jgi:hypothetical protein